MNKYLFACFVRTVGCNNVRGEIAGLREKFPQSHKNLIVCRIDASLITEEVTKHRSAMLKLDQLQKPNTTKIVKDGEGNDHTVIVYDYYDINGRNSVDCPIITLDDVELGEVS